MISISISTKKMFNRLLAGYHPHPIWPVRMPLNLSYTLAIRCYSSLWTCQVETPNIPCSKSHIHTPSPLSFQSIRPNPRSYVTFRNKLFYYGEELLAPRSTPRLEDHPLSVVATAHSIYWQLPSIPGGCLLHPQPENAPCSGERVSNNMAPTNT
jgi:hypothetical protein